MHRDGHVSKLVIRRILQTNRNMTHSVRLSETWCNRIAYDTISSLFPYLRLEAKAGCVFRDGSFDLVRCAAWEFRVDFDGDVQRGVGVAGEKSDDFFGDLNQSHFCGRSIDFD